MKKLFLIFLLMSGTASAQILKDNRSAAMRFGAEAGQKAGGAYFCQVDDEHLEIFISIAQAQINNMAFDKADTVAAHLAFSNNYSLWATEPPEAGCDRFVSNFMDDYSHLF